MSREKIIQELKEYFSIKELVSPAVFKKYGEARCWSFFDTAFLLNLLWLREYFDVPVTINDWSWGGIYDERGLRENVCDIAKGKTDKNTIYLSGHVLAKAADCDFKGISAVDIRKELSNLPPNDLPIYPMRLERKLDGEPISWVHFDTVTIPGQPHIYMFDV